IVSLSKSSNKSLDLNSEGATRPAPCKWSGFFCLFLLHDAIGAYTFNVEITSKGKFLLDGILAQVPELDWVLN
ncbi:hypothetical protein, partial [Flavobacterium subsaxonicum]|uniref:hypothetical protein n=1 Tax=Flavobacterium subsaxonicum TaxID=426226 RepID=UPI001A93C336